MTSPYPFPYAFDVLKATVAEHPGRLVAWDLPDDVVGFVGADADIAGALGIAGDENAARTADGTPLRIRLALAESFEETVVPECLDVGLIVVRIERIEERSVE